MMRILALACLLAAGSAVRAQSKAEPTLYVYGADWGPTTVEKAVYLARMDKINDTTYFWYTYHMYGPLMKTETFKDPEGQIAHGAFVTYNEKGRMDTLMNFRDGLADGHWYYLNDTGRVYQEDIYEKGRLQKRINRIVQDAIDEAEKIKADTLKKDPDEKESVYKGGLPAWARFLNRNLRYPERALNLKKQGMVVIQFIVDLKGDVVDPVIYQSVEYSLDQEALRIIRASNQWIAGQRDGKKIKTYKRQPIVFRLE